MIGLRMEADKLPSCFSGGEEAVPARRVAEGPTEPRPSWRRRLTLAGRRALDTCLTAQRDGSAASW